MRLLQECKRKRLKMNIVNALKKQNEAGKNIVTPDGNVISEDGIKKAAMKD